MVANGLMVHNIYEKDAEYRIETLNDLFLVLNYTIQNAPIFAPDIPHSAFQVSGIFVYMMFTLPGWYLFRHKEFNDKLRDVLDEWCVYLDSQHSLSVVNTDPQGWLSDKSVEANNLYEFVTEDQKCNDPDHWGFKSYNDFFHRNV